MSKKRTFRKGRLSEQVADELERLIPVEFPNPGDRWPTEAELADRFHVSRIVVREAIKVLEDRGLVQVQAGRGTVTRAPTPDKVKASLLRLFRNQPIPALDELESMLELREVLEETAASIAAVRATAEDVGEIEQALRAMEEPAADLQDRVDADLCFHISIAKATHNRYFEVVLDPLLNVFLQQISLTDSFAFGAEQHREILDAIREANPIKARQAARRLMRATARDMRRAFAVLAARNNAPAEK